MPFITVNAHSPADYGAAFAAENATIAGSVRLEKNSSVWYGAVLRADPGCITIGENSNVQDNAVLHTGPGLDVTIGRGVSIGHGAIVHGCTVGDNCLIGMHATILNGAVIGAGDQGIMVGYATNETEEYLPLPVVLAHRICKRLDELKPENPWLGTDGKAQVTVAYENDVPVSVTAVVVSLQHGVEIDHKSIRRFIGKEVLGKVLPRELLKEDTSILVNPSGKFTLGGPAADTGLTGRKLAADQYGPVAHIGGGALSGKDPTKVDRSGAYAARWVAKNLVAAGVADQILVELSYAIGIAQPLSIYVDTYRSPRPAALEGMTDGEIARRIGKLFDLRPAAIVKRFGLKNPIFEATASYGHFGNRPYTKVEKVWENGVETEREIEFFGWDKLDAVEQIRKEFGL